MPMAITESPVEIRFSAGDVLGLLCRRESGVSGCVWRITVLGLPSLDLPGFGHGHGEPCEPWLALALEEDAEPLPALREAAGRIFARLVGPVLEFNEAQRDLRTLVDVLWRQGLDEPEGPVA